MTSVNSNGQVIAANQGRDEDKVREKECYMLFLKSRTRRFATKFSRTDWESGKTQSGETGGSQLTVGENRKTIQQNWLTNRAARFSSVHTTKYE